MSAENKPTIEEIQQRFGFHPHEIGIRNRGWDMDGGNLQVCARDGGSNDIDTEAMQYPNFLGTEEDDFDCTYRYYTYRPLTDEERSGASEVSRLQAELDAARERVLELEAAFDAMRDAVLHERGPLAEQGAGSDVINAVLSIMDDCWPAPSTAQQPAAPSHDAPQAEPLRWMPIETAPRDGSHVLLWRPYIQFVGYWANAGWCHNAPGLPVMDPAPTHWMPLPIDQAGDADRRGTQP